MAHQEVGTLHARWSVRRCPEPPSRGQATLPFTCWEASVPPAISLMPHKTPRMCMRCQSSDRLAPCRRCEAALLAKCAKVMPAAVSFSWLTFNQARKLPTRRRRASQAGATVLCPRPPRRRRAVRPSARGEAEALLLTTSSVLHVSCHVWQAHIGHPHCSRPPAQRHGWPTSMETFFGISWHGSPYLQWRRCASHPAGSIEKLVGMPHSG